jgi:hypothetical protein
MKIKTAYKIFLEFHKELMIYQEHAQTFLEFEEEKNKKFVLVDDLVKELDKVWHKINTRKMDKLRDNFITKTQVASYLSELRDALTSNSSSDKSESFKFEED